jgi:hypothetical protein
VRRICAALISFLVLPATAMACPGQVGKVIFEDNFADDSGGWGGLGASSEVEIKDGTLLLHPNSRGVNEKNTGAMATNLMFHAGDGDYCTEFVFPKQPAPDNPVSAALMFWRTGPQDKFVFSITTGKSAFLYKMVDGNWNTVSENADVAAVNVEPDAVNSVRVLAKDGKLTLFVNGSQIKVIRAPPPTSALGFGVFASVNKATDGNPTVRFKSFKVTEGE